MDVYLRMVFYLCETYLLDAYFPDESLAVKELKAIIESTIEEQISKV